MLVAHVDRRIQTLAGGNGRVVVRVTLRCRQNEVETDIIEEEIINEKDEI